MAELLSSAELVSEAGISRRQLDYWTREGFLLPWAEVHGSGHPRHYASWQIPIAQRMRDLTRLGFGVGLAHAVAIDLLDHDHAVVGDYTITKRSSEA
jgi:DNA-binding transcriptional MerR regulator